MTTHRRAWISRAGVVVALAASALFALPTTPALADDPTVSADVSDNTLAPGERATLSFSILNNNDGGVLGDGTTTFTIRVDTFAELGCDGRCSFTETFNGESSKSFEVGLVARNVTAGQSRSGTVRVSANADNDDRDAGSATQSITIRGPEVQQVETVAEVSGRVTAEGSRDPVPGASVRLTDGAGNAYTVTTNSSGGYRFNGSESNRIAPGQLVIRASKDGINDSRTVSGRAGQRLSNQGIELALAVQPTPTPTPEASTEPTEEATVEGEEEEGELPAEGGQPEADNAANEDSGGSSSWLLILGGGLLVALGVGAIVLLVMRRKEGNDEDEDGPDGPDGGAPTGRGGYRGDDETRIAPLAGADPTMVNRQALADAPTMMHNTPLVEEFPDPYGAPLPGPQSPGYGSAQQNWDADDYDDAPGSGAGGYGTAPASGAAGYGVAPASGAGYGNAPASGAGYGTPVSGAGYRDVPGGYGEQFDEPTGRYTGRGTDEYAPAADPYETGYQPSSGAGHGGYEAEQRYAQAADGYDDAAYGAGRGYDEPRTGAGYERDDHGYGAGDGYDETRVAGYGQQGYDAEHGGYDQPATGGGYDQQRAGYDAQNGYGDRDYDDQQPAGGGYYDDSPRAGGGGHSRSATPQQPGRSERRSLDWLDD